MVVLRVQLAVALDVGGVEEQGLTPEALPENHVRQTTLLAQAFDAPGLSREHLGGFLALEIPLEAAVSRFGRTVHEG